jgi:beta-lactamase class A
MHRQRVPFWLAVVGLVVSALAAPAAAGELAALQRQVEQLARSFPGTVGVYARNLETGEEVAANADQLFPMASVYKIPILVELFRQADAGRFSLDERVTLTDAERTLGSGLLTYMSAGLQPTLRDLALLMIVVSDNEATDILLKRVGAANVTATMRALGVAQIRVDRTTAELITDWLGYAHEELRGKSPAFLLANPDYTAARMTPERMEQASRAFVEDRRDVASPRAMAELVAKIVRGEAASAAACQEMMQILNQQQFRQRLPRLLPPGVRAAHKTGTIGYTTNDAGVIYVGTQPVVLAVFTLRANNSVLTREAEERIGQIARAVFDYFAYTRTPPAAAGAAH